MAYSVNETESNEDYNYVSIGEKSVKVPYLLFALGIVMLVALFIYGNLYEDADVQGVLIWISLFAIVVSIAWTIRKKLIAVILAFAALLSIYYACGLALDLMNSEIAYSYGIVTFIIIGAFVFWISTDNEISWGDIGKIALFAILMYIINATAWLSGVNEITASYFTGGLPI